MATIRSPGVNDEPDPLAAFLPHEEHANGLFALDVGTKDLVLDEDLKEFVPLA